MPIAMSVNELNAFLQSGQPIYLLDVRWPGEQAIAALPESKLIPLPELPARLGEVKPESEQKLVVYCHHGVRSWHAAEFLEQQGYGPVHSLEGGIDAWSQLIDPSIPRYH
jgi:rhodanese-related sulfurtransferase